MGGSQTKAAKNVWYDGFVASMPSQQGKNIAITGTTSGTGLEAAKAIASRGGNVFVLNRPSQRVSASMQALKAEAAKEGGTATQVDCDLQDFSSVRKAAAELKKHLKGKGLDGLLNNAGVMRLPEKATKDGYEVQLQTNHLSHFLLSSLLLPDLEKAAAACGEARIVNHSSIARHGAPLDGKYFEPLSAGNLPEDLAGDDSESRGKRYHQTKLANVVFTLALKDKLEAKGSKVTSLVAHPGVSATNLMLTTNASMSEQEQQSGRMKMVNMMLPYVAQSAADGSLPLLAAAVCTDAQAGDFYGPGKQGPLAMLAGEGAVGPPVKIDWEARAEKEAICTDAEAKRILWELSEKAIGQQFF